MKSEKPLPANENHCIFCGKVIPEGRQLCPCCEQEFEAEDTKGRSGLLEEE